MNQVMNQMINQMMNQMMKMMRLIVQNEKFNYQRKLVVFLLKVLKKLALHTQKLNH